MEEIIRRAVKNIKKEQRFGDQKKKEKGIKHFRPNIAVIGIGGAGGNTLTRMQEIGIYGAEIIAMNTDAQDLLETPADKRLLLGKKLTKGLGAGSNPAIGEAAAKESVNEIKELIKKKDMIFITCGLGGGTGTGAAPIVAEVAKDLKVLSVAVVTLPFTVEGRKRIENALEGLSRLMQNVDTIIVIPNDKILEIAPDLPINAAFKVADEILTNAVKGIVEIVTKPALINVDFADLKTIMHKGGAAMIGLGESATKEVGEERALAMLRGLW